MLHIAKACAYLYSSVGSFGFCGVAPNVYDDDPVYASTGGCTQSSEFIRAYKRQTD